MKALTARLDDRTYERIKNLSEENKTSINKTVSKIIINSYEQPNEIYKYIKSIDFKLDKLERDIDTILKRQYSHIKISKQHFVNHGYLSNADISEDKCLKELFSKDNNFNG